jgi:alpha-tubulin suppressor-like RCC1 family protein
MKTSLAGILNRRRVVSGVVNNLLFGLGANWFNNISTSNTQFYTTPYQVDNSEWISVSNGIHSAYGVRSDGTLWAWGQNSGDDFLAVGNINPTHPLQVGSDTDWAKVVGSQYGAYAIKQDGALYAWGEDSQVLGFGNTQINVMTPSLLPGTWSHIAAAQVVTLGIKTDNTLWAWGSDSYGVLGTGVEDVGLWSPTQVGTSTWNTVDMVKDMSIGIQSDGTMWSWGRWNNGATGNGGTTDITESLPVHIGVGYTWSRVACGIQHKLAIRSDGTLWSWGSGDLGVLGLGDLINRYEPTQVGTDSDWVFIKAGWYFSSALKADGSLWVWGENVQVMSDGSDYAAVLIPTKISKGPYKFISHSISIEPETFLLTGTNTLPVAIAFNAIATFSLGYDISNYTTIEFNGLFNVVQTTVVNITANVAELNFLNSNAITYGSGSGAPLVELTLTEAQVTQPSAFNGIPTLQKFTCNTMSTIAASTFQQCASLQTVILPAVSTIGTQAFVGCTALDLDLSDFSSCVVIEAQAFSGCTALTPHITTQHFPSLTHLGKGVFSASSVGRIELPTVTSVDTDGPIFTSVGHIQLNGLSSIQGTSFVYCTSYILEFAGCVSVGDYAFANWSPVGAALSWLYLPVVTTWGNDVFHGVSGLSVTLTIRTDQQSNPNVLYLQANNDVTLVLV